LAPPAPAKVPSLSGGEAARLIFARIAVDEPNVLILDEPTNHLDLEAIEALVAGLAAFDGTLIFVSHDRWFVSQLATRVFEINEHGVSDYPGTYDEYLASCGDDHLDADAAILRVRREKRARKRGGQKSDKNAVRTGGAKKRKIELRRDAVTAAIEKAEQRIEEIDAAFCEPGFFEVTAETKIRSMQGKRDKLAAELEELMAEWEEIESDLETAQ
jgi:ABC-type multidrug transport system ATPase subunit